MERPTGRRTLAPQTEPGHRRPASRSPTPTRWSPDVVVDAALTRRALLRGAGALGAGALLAACGGGDGPDPATSPTAGGTGTGGGDATRAAIEAAGLGDAEHVLTPIVATFEVLTGGASRVQFGVLDATNTPMMDADVRAWVVRPEDASVVQGPVEPTWYGEGLGARGVYVFEADLAEAGIHDLVIGAEDGRLVGTAALRVIAPEASVVPRPGQPFPAVATPTDAEPGDLAELCTREPDCGMHEVSLDEVLGTAPVVFTVATPKYCQTAVCGPVVDVVVDAREDAPEGFRFVHAEVFVDAGNTPTQTVTDLGLPTEPWTWVIAADGTVVDRFDGPVVPELLAAAIADAT